MYRTSSHVWGRWYLPMFLFRDGSLTLMNRASLIALVRFWSSLPTIVKLLMLMLWPEMLQWSNIGEGAFWCSLNLSAKFLADSPIYSSLHPCWLHLYLYMTPLLFVIGFKFKFKFCFWENLHSYISFRLHWNSDFFLVRNKSFSILNGIRKRHICAKILKLLPTLTNFNKIIFWH